MCDNIVNKIRILDIEKFTKVKNGNKKGSCQKQLKQIIKI